MKDGKIRFGLGSIKNVGTIPINSIIAERNKNGNFESFESFCERIADESVNKKCIESLIKAGVFEEFPQNRATLLASFEMIIDQIQSTNKKGMTGQVTMFDLNAESEENVNELKYSFLEQPECSEKELLSQEKEMLGIYISGHPLEKIMDQIKEQTNINTMQIKQIDNGESIDFKDGQSVIVAGIISSVKKKYTKNNKVMVFLTIEDLYGAVEVIAFENVYFKAIDSLVVDNVVIVDGRLSIREDEETKIMANEIKTFGSNQSKNLILDISNTTEENKVKLRGALKFFNGEKNNMPVSVKIEDDLKSCGAIYFNDEIQEVFEDILGKANVAIQ